MPDLAYPPCGFNEYDNNANGGKSIVITMTTIVIMILTMAILIIKIGILIMVIYIFTIDNNSLVSYNT